MVRLLPLAVAALSCLVLAACSVTLSLTTATPFINGGGATTASNICGLLSADDLNNIIPDQGFIAGSEQGIYCNLRARPI